MRPIPAIARRQRGVFTTAQATADGWTESALRHAVRVDDLIVVRRGVFAEAPPGELPRHARASLAFVQASAAALLAVPRSVASHASAAAVLNLPLWSRPVRPCLTTLPSATGDVTGVHLHRNAIGWDWGTVGALRCTSPARTVVGVTGELGGLDGVVVADAALRRGLLRRADLDDLVATLDGHRGVVAARQVARFADPLAESPLESVSRWRMAEFGLPAPMLQPDVFVQRRFVGRFDFYWDEFGVFGEADGWGKYGADDAERRVNFRDERRRQRALERADGIVERWYSDEVADFGLVADRLRAAFARGARLPRAERGWTVRPSTPSAPRAVVS